MFFVQPMFRQPVWKQVAAQLSRLSLRPAATPRYQIRIHCRGERDLAQMQHIVRKALKSRKLKAGQFNAAPYAGRQDLLLTVCCPATQHHLLMQCVSLFGLTHSVRCMLVSPAKHQGGRHGS